MIHVLRKNYEDPLLMFKRSTRMNRKHCMCLLCLVVLILITVYCIQSVEGFNSVPDACGTAGWRISPGFAKFRRSWTGVDEDINAKRQYTISECNKIEGAVFAENICYKPKNASKKTLDDNIDINYGDLCAGLKTMSTSPPNECTVDGTLLGIANKEFSFTIGDKTIIMPNNSIRLHTKNECDKLKGNWNDDTRNMTDKEKKTYNDLHGLGYGTCGGAIEYYVTCNSDAAPSASEEASNLAKKHLKNWLA